MKPSESKAMSVKYFVLSALMSESSAFRSHGVFTGFIGLSEQTAITSLNTINVLVLIMEIQLVVRETVGEDVECMS